MQYVQQPLVRSLVFLPPVKSGLINVGALSFISVIATVTVEVSYR